MAEPGHFGHHPRLMNTVYSSRIVLKQPCTTLMLHFVEVQMLFLHTGAGVLRPPNIDEYYIYIYMCVCVRSV